MVNCRTLLLLLFLIIAPSLPAAPAPLEQTEPADHLDLPEQALASELKAMWTRDADKLVDVLRQARPDDHPLPLTFMLAIAHAETNGRILLVSAAGAVGLAQATPIAYLAEQMDGPLYVTSDYADGARAYFLKKPLWDVVRITTLLIESPEGVDNREAVDLLNAAFRYRREGVDDLELLVPLVGEGFWLRALQEDQQNLELLLLLERMISECASTDAFEGLREGALERYQEMKEEQRIAWTSYEHDLSHKRDELLRERFGADPKEIIRHRAWEAAEVLATELDDRFSPYSMARFLVRHTETKLTEAFELGVAESDLIRVTAGLYNGGGHNMKRLRSGLLRSLKETVNYMEKVPATQRRLEQRLMASEQMSGTIPAGR